MKILLKKALIDIVTKKGFHKDNGARKNKDDNIIEADYRDLDDK